MLYGHNKYCNCFECQPDHVDAILTQPTSISFNHADITKYPESKLLFAPFNKTVSVYKGGKIVRKVSNGNAIGMGVEEIKTQLGTIVIQLSSGEQVIKSDLANEQLTSSQITKDAKAQTTERAPNLLLSDELGDKLYSAGGYLDQLSGFWSKAKWFMIAVVIIILIAVFLRIKG